jgi:two-component system osmolarity sensor histidine kinase EnvZ
MKLQLAMMAEDDGVTALNEDVAEMERMLEGYLAFARGEGSENPEPRDVIALLGEAVRQARRKGGTVDLEAEGEFELPLRPSAFLRCITNLLDNAQRYATHVSVRAQKRARGIEVVIDDDGPGIPLDKREEVFKPFFRLEGSRNPVTGGVGLGLTIARDVVRGHGGDIFLGESPSGGLRVRLRLPL